MTASEAVSKRVRELLAQKGMTIYRLQKDSGMSPGSLGALMYNHHKGVTLSTIITITKTLGISLQEFFDSPIFEDIK